MNIVSTFAGAYLESGFWKGPNFKSSIFFEKLADFSFLIAQQVPKISQTFLNKVAFQVISRQKYVHFVLFSGALGDMALLASWDPHMPVYILSYNISVNYQIILW